MDNNKEIEYVKVSPWGLKRKEREIHTFVVHDKTNEIDVPFRFQDPSLTVVLSVPELQQEYIEAYLKPKNGKEPQSLPHIDGKPTEINETTIALACSMYILQIKDDPLFYSIEELMGHIVALDDSMMEVIGFVNSMGEKFSGLLENPTQAVI